MALNFVQHFNRCEGFPFEHRKARTTAGAHVGHRILEAQLGDRGRAVTAADDGNRLAIGDRLRNRLRSFGKRSHLEYAHRTVPNNRLG